MRTFCCFLACLSLFNSASCDIERRGAIDIGSGATKVAFADVDTDTNQIVEVILESSFPVAYQTSLDKSVDGTFDASTRAAGLKAFWDIKNLASHHGVQKVTAIATSAFRKANNSSAFIADVLHHSGLHIKVIPQREEGEIAFLSAMALGVFDPERAIVWEIGTGSLQMSTKNGQEDGLCVYMGEHMGSAAFNAYLIQTIQGHNLVEFDSPNPINSEELSMADRYARAFARHAYPIIKTKIQDGGVVVGIGRLFCHSVFPIAAHDGVITRGGLRCYIREALGKTDEELQNPFAHVDVSNCILTLAIMKALHIHEIHPVETSTTRGLLISPAYWKEM